MFSFVDVFKESKGLMVVPLPEPHSHIRIIGLHIDVWMFLYVDTLCSYVSYVVQKIPYSLHENGISASYFPLEEKYGLSQQMRRAAISVCSNIAEGTSRISVKDQAHFTTMAFGSLMELLNQVIIAFGLEYISGTQLTDIRNKIQPLSIKLSNLKKSQLSKLNP